MLNEWLNGTIVGASVAALGAAVMVTCAAADHAATMRLRRRDYLRRHTPAHNAPARARAHTRTHA